MTMRYLYAMAILGALPLAPLAVWAAEPLMLDSVNVELPTSDRLFPDGPGADAINANCLTCHSAGMVLNQPAMPRAAWAAEVNKMIKVYRAPIAAEDVGPIVDYLARTKGAR